METQKVISFTFVVLFGVAALALMPCPARASVIYSYTGNNFNSILDTNPPDGNYGSSMYVSGSFTLASPLDPSLPSTDISSSILGYSFSDGRQTLDEGNSTLFNFSFTTDSSGLISNWEIDIRSVFNSPSFVGDFERRILSSFDSADIFASIDKGSIAYCRGVSVADGSCTFYNLDFGNSAVNPGSWEVGSVSTVPLPSSLLLFGSALVGLVGIMRRRLGLAGSLTRGRLLRLSSTRSSV